MSVASVAAVAVGTVVVVMIVMSTVSVHPLPLDDSPARLAVPTVVVRRNSLIGISLCPVTISRFSVAHYS